MRDEN
jgi:hypothetical protein